MGKNATAFVGCDNQVVSGYVMIIIIMRPKMIKFTVYIELRVLNTVTYAYYAECVFVNCSSALH